MSGISISLTSSFSFSKFEVINSYVMQIWFPEGTAGDAYLFKTHLLNGTLEGWYIFKFGASSGNVDGW